jgi:hypothetical protein
MSFIGLPILRHLVTMRALFYGDAPVGRQAPDTSEGGGTYRLILAFASDLLAEASCLTSLSLSPS